MPHVLVSLVPGSWLETESGDSGQRMRQIFHQTVEIGFFIVYVLTRHGNAPGTMRVVLTNQEPGYEANVLVCLCDRP